MNRIIDNIKKNALNSKEISIIAKNNNVSYDVAKIMYHDDRKDISKAVAIELLQFFRYENIPITIMGFLNVNDIKDILKYSYGSIIGLLYIKIGESINNKYVNELNNYCPACYEYGKLIYSLIKDG